jgi:thiamine biosynthesis protein ThiI
MNETPDQRIIVLRYGELFLKGGNRRSFERLLRKEVERAVAEIADIDIDHGQGRLFLRCPRQSLHRASRRLSRVFGLSSLSVGIAVPPEIHRMAAAALQLIDELGRSPASFKVETRRSDKRFPLTSPEVSRAVGAEIASRSGIPVRLVEPDLVVGVEIGPRRTFVFVERIPGAGGLPVGSEGQVLLLLSGGIDSPVAGYLMQKRGCLLRAVYFHAPPHTSERAKDKVLRLAAHLAAFQGRLLVDIVRFTEIQCNIRDSAPRETVVVLYRRMMMRIASQLARRSRCGALATGENLGQVASQTLANLACIEEAASLPVLRPLISYDKQETVALARGIGTFETSIEPHVDCCSLFVPKHPATRLSLERALAAEAGLDPGLLEQALETVETVATDAPSPFA